MRYEVLAYEFPLTLCDSCFSSVTDFIYVVN